MNPSAPNKATGRTGTGPRRIVLTRAERQRLQQARPLRSRPDVLRVFFLGLVLAGGILYAIHRYTGLTWPVVSPVENRDDPQRQPHAEADPPQGTMSGRAPTAALSDRPARQGGRMDLPDADDVRFRPAPPLDVGSDRQLFVDRYVIELQRNVELKLHAPVKQPLAESPLPGNFYVTVLKDEDESGLLYRAYWRGRNPAYDDPERARAYLYAESRDGHEWERPRLGLYEMDKTRDNNVILTDMPGLLRNFSPFIDTRPGVDQRERYKAVAGYPGGGNKRELTAEQRKGLGLHAFVSADGIHWEKRDEIIPFQAGWRHAFDSQNVAFWSEAEQQYVCYFRTWTGEDGLQNIRTISRTTSPDFVTWSDPVPMNPNLPGEQFYTSQTHPYFRAPQIYIALPTRFIPGQGGDAETEDAMLGLTDILFMTTRAGSAHYDRLFNHAYIWPGRDPDRWGNRANYVALNVVPTGADEMSIYHRSGHRYTLRTDGFVSAHAGYEEGELITKPIRFEGDSLEVNYRTSAGGSLRMELLHAGGDAIPGFTAEEGPLLVGDEIERFVRWEGDLTELEGRPVRLRFLMRECDVFSFRFTEASRTNPPRRD